MTGPKRRSPLGWFVDRYVIERDKRSGIVEALPDPIPDL